MPKQISVIQRFGERVRLLRQKRSWSQEKFAEICNLDRTYISGIERGVRNVSLRNIAALAQGLGISLDELFKDM
ncbi:MAG: helix-turn-helix transcriptional regulator [Chloroflexi bacterium]|nr:helix-turn-helix transcriptional regulator [Chloroflexota bacterium]